MTVEYITCAFVLMLAIGVGLRIWLSLRHIRHISTNRDQVPKHFVEKISLPAHQKAADYSIVKSRMSLVDLGVDTLLLLALTLGGGLSFLHEFWSTYFASMSLLWQNLWQGTALIFSIGLISTLIGLPLSVYRQFILEERFGFNRMTGRIFLSDLFKSFVLTAVLGIPVILTILWIMSASGGLWWFYVWLFWSAFSLLLLFIYPTWISPLFNQFAPLQDPILKSRIEALLNRCGFAAKGLFVMDGSKRSSHGNAYFTGFGKSRRIVFFDTLLNSLQPAEIEAVLAHELGHFKHNHVTKRMIVTLALSLLFFWVLGQVSTKTWFYLGFGVEAQSIALALVLFFLVVPIFLFPFTPAGSFFSRRDEFEADRYAAENSDAENLIQALIKLYEDNASTLTPDPLHSAFYDSHPPALMRINQLRASKPNLTNA